MRAPAAQQLRIASALVRAIAGVAVAGLGMEARATTTTIDFESIATGAQSSDFLSAQGVSSVTLVRDGSVAELVTVNSETAEPNGNASNPGGGNYLASAGNNIAGERVLTLVFSTDLTVFSFRRIDVDGQVSIPGNWTVTAFDGSGIDLGISKGESGADYIFPSSDASFTLVAPAGTRIQRVEFSIEANLSTFAVAPIDDLLLSSEPVPEPSTVSLVALGLIGLVLRRRRRL
jgi:hypothetical protein